ncbi:murein biosynthesis integral membrane protein MurJ [Francisella sp. Scap27]|uniref:murein biosynthesis integral membrane protein MurJ n=1 Tax=Francisella sp. Scap27 TaxID=2589986 RepID=UPI0015BA2286|nr:murein biosynthesis integral membrane protein MurJ [Francisella sp. Scap27]QLE78944.1 murein biosynthesis integral membrane protein MurJ [Francisella sp. Scap27]
MKKFFSKSLLVSSFLLLSKILGFLRDMLLAMFFGSSGAMQAFLIAFRFPEFIRKVTSSGIITQIMNPHLEDSISTKQREFIATVLYFIAVVLLLIVILMIAFSDFIVDLYAYGFSKDTSLQSLIQIMFVIMIPYVLFNFMVGLISAVLNSHRKYFVSSMLPIILNLVMIAGIVCSKYFNVAIYAVAYSVLVAGVIQLIVALWALYRLAGKLSLSRDIFLLKNIEAKSFLRKMPMAFFGSAILQINGLVETFFASFLVSGSLAWLYYADRVNQFLYGVFGTAIATVMIPYLVKCKTDAKTFYKNLAWILKVTMLITIPAIVGLCVLSKPIVITLFYYGKFSVTDVNATQLALLGYLLALFCFVVVRVIVSGLYVQNQAHKVFYIGVTCLVISVLVDIYIIKVFAGDKNAFLYLAYSSSFIALVNLLSQMLLMVEFNFNKFVEAYLPFRFLCKILIGCICMFVVLKMFDLSDSYWISLSFFGRVEHIVIVILSGIISFIGVLWLLGVKSSLKLKA